MLKVDESALLCDFAEYYRLYDFDTLPALTVATLAMGLREESRIKMKLSGQKYTMKEILLMGILDRLTLLVYAKTKDGQKGKNYPKLLCDEFHEKAEDKLEGFSSGKAFDAMRERLLKGGEPWQRN